MKNNRKTKINFIINFIADIFHIKLFKEECISFEQVNNLHEEGSV